MSRLGKLVRFLFGRKLVEDRVWMEVVFANNYALFMGYLSMAVKGLGFLVLTWTTVVLLGGFVSELQEKDFWCLTFITLVQTAGIFDVFLTEKLSNLGYSFVGYVMVSSNHGLGPVLTAILAVVFVILLCPLVAVYMFGLLISMGISVWRLRQHDYGSGRANLKPALDVLYSLALLQGVIFCYKVIFGFAKGSVVEEILTRRCFTDESYSNVGGGISEYLNEMMVRCEKDPSSARGRNLITYAVDRMEFKSPDDYLSGVRILDAFARKTEESIIDLQEAEKPYWEYEEFMEHEHVLMKHLIIYASSSDILKKLPQTLGYRSIYDTETRERAARIVSSVAEDIRLEEFPRGIHYISSLIDTFKEYHLLKPYQRDLHLLHETYKPDSYEAKLQVLTSGPVRTVLGKFYRQLMVQGLHILRKLATNDDNCRVMLNTPCLLPKIMAPLTSDLLHHVDHDAWSDIVEDSLKVIAQLMAATGPTGNKLRSEISSSNAAINTMERILGCDKCNDKLQKQVIWILSRIYMDRSLILKTGSREKFIEMLVDLMIDGSKSKETKRGAAAMALVALSYKTERSATIIMKANDNVVDNLTAMIVQNHKCGPSVAQILEYLCIHYTDNDESLRKLQKTMTDAVPKVFRKIVYGDSQENGRGNNSSSSNQRDCKMSENEVIHMLSLSLTVCDTFISEDQDLALLLAAIAPRDGSFSFPRKLKEIVVKNRHPRQSCLRTVKLTCKMVISMMNHRGRYVKEDLERLMNELYHASKEMFLLDGSMAFDITNNDTTTSKPFDSLASLVKEAQELMDKNYGL